MQFNRETYTFSTYRAGETGQTYGGKVSLYPYVTQGTPTKFRWTMVLSIKTKITKFQQENTYYLCNLETKIS